MSVAGVDGCRSGWLTVTCGLTAEVGVVAVEVVATLAPLADRLGSGELSVVAIDIPIGLPSEDRRVADDEARRILGNRRSTLFFTPDHAVLETTSYPEANAISRAVTGKGLSKQAWNLVAKTREARSVFEPGRDDVHEVHPETSFTVMNGGNPLPPKRSSEGVAARIDLLSASFAAVPDHLVDIPIGAGIDDVLDGFAAAWTARRIASGDALLLGSGADPDGYALTMRA